MLRVIKILAVVFLVVLGSSCVEPFGVRSLGFDKAVVVEGRLTNEKKVHYVKLSYTRPVDEDENAPITNAVVWVSGSDGSKIEFIESEPGYYTCGAEIAGVEGLTYQLFFVTSDDRHYQSHPQELIASPPIDSIYQMYAEKAGSISGDVKKGIQFYIDSHGENTKGRFYKYEWEETYEVYAQYPSYYEFVADLDTVVARTDEASPCYASGKSRSIILGTTANLVDNRLSRIPVRYITSETDHLRTVYSILVRQFVISSEAYGYYKDILENNNNNSSLFEKQLGAVVGNIKSVEDTEETVLGFFEVSGVSQKRAFFKYEDFDPRFPWPEEQYPCPSRHRIDTPDSLHYYVTGRGYGIISAEYMDDFVTGKRLFSATLAPRYCTDCRFRGPATKPDFWIY